MHCELLQIGYFFDSLRSSLFFSPISHIACEFCTIDPHLPLVFVLMKTAVRKLRFLSRSDQKKLLKRSFLKMHYSLAYVLGHKTPTESPFM